MSEQEKQDLRDLHPNLHEAVTHGALMEPNRDFVRVAEQFPISDRR